MLKKLRQTIHIEAILGASGIILFLLLLVGTFFIVRGVGNALPGKSVGISGAQSEILQFNLEKANAVLENTWHESVVTGR